MMDLQKSVFWRKCRSLLGTSIVFVMDLHKSLMDVHWWIGECVMDLKIPSWCFFTKRDGLANDVSSQKYDVSSNNSPLNQLTSTQSTSNLSLHRAPTVPMRDYWLDNRSTALRRRWYWGCCEIGARAGRAAILDVVRWAVEMGIVGFGNPKWRKTQKNYCDELIAISVKELCSNFSCHMIRNQHLVRIVKFRWLNL